MNKKDKKKKEKCSSGIVTLQKEIKMQTWQPKGISIFLFIYLSVYVSIYLSIYKQVGWRRALNFEINRLTSYKNYCSNFLRLVHWLTDCRHSRTSKH